IDLAPSEAMRLSQCVEALASCGFDVISLSGSSVGVRSVPGSLVPSGVEPLLRGVASSEDSDADLRSRLLDELAASMSCRAAVKMHHPLTQREMEELVAELFRSEQPYACPHGRPIVLKMEDRDLERRFGRSG
ncbi:MAG: hypothetical protein VYE73_06575, partial [Acidobacteriota bacterium]|nr:hypothetical protein [Acidobacteriota bacterium]